MLNYISHNIPKDNYELVKNENNYSSTQAYIIKNKSAKNFINKFYKSNKFDLTSYNLHVADHFLYNKMITYCYKYPYFTYSFTNDSFIHTSHLSFHNESKEKTFTLSDSIISPTLLIVITIS